MDLRGWDYTGRNIGPDLHRIACQIPRSRIIRLGETEYKIV